MKYNDGNMHSPKFRRRLKLCGLFVFFFLLMIVLTLFLRYILRVFKMDISTDFVLTFATILSSLVVILSESARNAYNKSHGSKRGLDVKVEVNGQDAIITCYLDNIDTERIVPKGVFLIVNKGEINGDKYDFRFPLVHEPGDEFCLYSHLCRDFEQFPEYQKCRGQCHMACDSKNCNSAQSNSGTSLAEKVALFEEQFSNEEYHRIFSLDFLTKKSKLFIDPGESFFDEVVLHLEPGVYRAIMIWIPENAVDCGCAQKHFIIN